MKLFQGRVQLKEGSEDLTVTFQSQSLSEWLSRVGSLCRCLHDLTALEQQTVSFVSALGIVSCCTSSSSASGAYPLGLSPVLPAQEACATSPAYPSSPFCAPATLALYQLHSHSTCPPQSLLLFPLLGSAPQLFTWLGSLQFSQPHV